MKKKSDSRSRRFLQHHLGSGAWIKLIAFAILGLVLSWPVNYFLGPLSFLGMDTQEEYQPRSGNMEWIFPDLGSEHKNVGRVLGLGRTGQGAWSSRAQMEQLICYGSDVQTAMLINSISQAILPDGWLSLPGVEAPRQSGRAVLMLEQMWDELSISQILHRQETGEQCQTHPSWEEEKTFTLEQHWPDVQINDHNWHNARERLKITAQKSALAQLMLSPGLGGVEGMIRVADLLDLAGERISLATGMKSQKILGLNGRVAMTLLSTDHLDPYAGMAQTRKMPNSQTDNPIIDVVAEDSLGVIVHEWFHSLDLGVAPLVLGSSHPGQSWLDQRHRLDISVVDAVLHRAMKAPVVAYGEMGKWHQAQRNQTLSNYWSNPAEAMAYAFEWWAYTNLDEHACQEREHGQGDGRPTPGEAACLNRAWKHTWNQILPPLLK